MTKPSAAQLMLLVALKKPRQKMLNQLKVTHPFNPVPNLKLNIRRRVELSLRKRKFRRTE